MDTGIDWSMHVAAWPESGDSMVGYCRRHGLKASALGYRKKRLAALGSGHAEEGAVPIAHVVRRGERQAGGGTERSALRLVVCGVMVEVAAGFDDATLVRVLDVLAKWGSA